MNSPAPMVITLITADLVRGAIELESTTDGVIPHRLPAWARMQSGDSQLLMAESQPSGVRVAFRSQATAVELEARPTKIVYVGTPSRADAVYDVLVDGVLVGQGSISTGNILSIDMATGAVESRPGPSGSVRFDGLPARVKDIEIWLPHNEVTELLTLRTDAPVTLSPHDSRPQWLHHGSSISHGSNAATPSTTWPAIAAAAGGVAPTNLGMGGSALLDQFTARAMRDRQADLISVKIGINLVNLDLMRLRAFGPAVHGFLDTIRDGHPDAPLLVVSPIWCPIHEDTPGPGALDISDGHVRFVATGSPAERAAGKLSLRVIREELSRIVEQRSDTDPHLHHLDGQRLYGEADFADLPLPDALHPDGPTHRLIGERFALLVFAEGGAFASTSG